MPKFRLSGNITVLAIDDYPFAQQPPHAWKDSFVLIDATRNKEYLINETIKYFLDKFYAPRSKDEVFEEIASELESTAEQINKYCNNFFRFLCKRKLLVSENQPEESYQRTYFLKNGDKLGDLTIKEQVSNKRHIDIYIASIAGKSQPCIIKLLNKNKMSVSSDFREQLDDLRNEYQLLLKADSNPYISHVYELNTTASSPYLRMEFINGISLSKFLLAPGRLDENDIYKIIRQVLEGFALLHGKKIVHGDIHPSNILVTPEKKIRIIDLGLSIDTSIESDEIVRVGGVNFYMPPERINIRSINKFTKEPDFHSDVYQIGLMIYLLLYNKTPFTGYIWEELALNIKTGEIDYPVLSFLDFPVNPGLISLLQKCLHIRSRKRYSNAWSIYEAFKKLNTDVPQLHRHENKDRATAQT
jgi:serine/threonine protein kinase